MAIATPIELASKGVPLIRLMHLISPTLPVGAYAYSRGLEQAAELGWVTDERTCRLWIEGMILHSLARVDAPILLRAYRAYADGDLAAVDRWAEIASALRESAELREEDRITGASLAQILADLGIAEARPWSRRPDACFSLLFGLAAVRWNISRDEALVGYLFAMADAMVGAAIRIISLGQTAGHRILAGLDPVIQTAASIAEQLPDEELGAPTHGLALASALHETVYTRLFRS